jgi:sulfite reductase (NADPH) flavoprotein alpha-component
MSTQAHNGNLLGLEPHLLGQLNQLAQTLTPQQIAWVGGYFTGLSAQGGQSTSSGTPAPGPQSLLTILYGSQTGHAREVATELNERAREAGLATELCSMGKFKEKQLKQIQYLAVVISTQGEGDPPDDALSLDAFLHSQKAPNLEGLHFAVCGLGDSSYEFYCKTGKDFDLRLEELGGKRLLDRVDLDVDFDDGASKWISDIIPVLKDRIPPATAPAGSPAGFELNIGQPTVHYSRKKPLKTRLLVCQKITGRHSDKDIRHIEIDLTESGLTYQPGDALGVWFRNDEELVTDLLKLLQIDPATTIHVNEEPRAIHDALVEQYELTQLHPSFVTDYATLTKNDSLRQAALETESLRQYVGVRQIIDVIREHPAKVEAQAFVELLRKLTPRLYSIASSQSEVEEEVHITLGVVQYEAHGHYHLGGASGFLGHRLKEGEEVLIYVEPNDNFRLPQDPDTPVIMIGPGTGIAPFRAFLQERAATDAKGDNWLFFGNPRFTEDFLYQTEWQDYLSDGLLTHLDVAFLARPKGKNLRSTPHPRKGGGVLDLAAAGGAYLSLR